MFIVSTKRFKVRRADGSPYFISKGFVGEIPEDVADTWLIQSAIKEGSISTPNKSDKAIEQAISTSEEKAKTTQKRREKRSK